MNALKNDARHQLKSSAEAVGTAAVAEVVVAVAVTVGKISP